MLVVGFDWSTSNLVEILSRAPSEEGAGEEEDGKLPGIDEPDACEESPPGTGAPRRLPLPEKPVRLGAT